MFDKNIQIFKYPLKIKSFDKNHVEFRRQKQSDNKLNKLELIFC